MELVKKEVNCTLKLNQSEIERILSWYVNLRQQYDMGRGGLDIEDTYLYDMIIELTGIQVEENIIKSNIKT